MLKEIIYSQLIQKIRNYIKPLAFFFFKDLHKKTFRFNGFEYHYFTKGSYNNPWKNERAVEVAVAINYLKRYEGKKVLEVGNVLSNYIKTQHDIIDPYDNESSVIKEDIVNYQTNKKYDLIICISTLEHIGWDMGDGENGSEPDKSIKAVKRMKELLAKDGLLIVTTPFGYNPYLDERILNNKLPFTEKHYLKRTSILNYWKEIPNVTRQDMNYGIIIMSAKTLFIGMIQK